MIKPGNLSATSVKKCFYGVNQQIVVMLCVAIVIFSLLLYNINSTSYDWISLKQPLASIPVLIIKSNKTFVPNPRANVCPTDNNAGVYVKNLIDQSQNRTKYILIWNRPHGVFRAEFKNCEYKDCALTVDKCDFPRSDAVLFHAPTVSVTHVPKRVPGQIFIYMGFEAPEYFYAPTFESTKWHNVFNWTWSYRRDADIAEQHGKIVPKSQDMHLINNFYQVLRSKKNLAAMFVSNCKTRSKREKYVKLMQKYVDVDVYGRCGPLKCPKSMHGNCTDNLQKNYKFYLSFENSLCQDYITEKALQIVNKLVVPVIRGGTYVDMYMPPKSYINTQDFSSVKKLTDYLLKISSNQTEYEEFYKWRKHYRLSGDSTSVCQLCKMLHNVEKYKRIYTDIHAWSTQIDDKPICITDPKDFH